MIRYIIDGHNVLNSIQRYTKLLDRDYARQMGEKGRNAVFEKFNIEQTTKELVRIYEGIIK